MPWESQRLTGTVVKIDDSREFAFIFGVNGTRYFVHRTAVQGVAFEALRVGRLVSFEIDETDPRGPRAGSVREAAE